MCSTVCEYTICDSHWGGCREAAEDEKKTKEVDLAICSPTTVEPCSKPGVDQDCSVTHVEQSIGLHGSSVADSVREQLQKSITKNFEGREYITRPTLLQIMSKDVVHGLCQTHVFDHTHSRVAMQMPVESGQNITEYTEMEAMVLLALCIFIDVPMQSFLALLEAGISDASLPLAGDCPASIDEADFVRIVGSQWIFLPYDLLAQPDQVVIPKDLIVPLIFDKKRDLIGSGAFSDVFRATVDNIHCTVAPVVYVYDFQLLETNFLQKPERAPIYALKRFKDNPGVEKSFRREHSILQELVKIPHEHILLHLAAWSQHGVFYMIFPQARCNLRTFMDGVERPGFAAEHVVWFFEQLRGLADAVRHLHALKALPALVQFRKGAPVAGSEKMAFHNDIKPENILVFEPDDGSLGLMKISDFGCGKVVKRDSNSAVLAAERFYGTPEYESPDIVTQNELSKPNDIWALGCVYLELLDWFTVPKTEVQMSFQSQRYTGPGPSNAAFWYRDTDGKIKLKPQVGRKLMDLEKKYCYSKWGLQDLLHIIWFLLDVDMKDRTTAEQLYNDVNYLTRQTIFDVQKDPDYYINASNYGDDSHLLVAALPTPSWLADKKKGGYHNAEWPYLSSVYDWDAIRAQQPEFEGHEPYLNPEDHRRARKLEWEKPGYRHLPSPNLNKPWGILNRPIKLSGSD